MEFTEDFLKIMRLLLRQTIMDFRRRHLGTFLGAIWAILSPLVNIALIYFVFSYGLKASVVEGVSFINWFVPAMLGWLFISEAIATSCLAFTESSYLITKIVFPVWILPLSKVISVFIVHLCFMSFFVITLLFQEFSIQKEWLQLIYYFLCAFSMCVASAFIVSTIMVFLRDILNIVGVLLQILFWATPIFWNSAMLKGSSFEWVLLSPINYILQGYRDSLFDKIWFWERPLQTFIFWGFTGGALCVGIFMFKRAKPHFADVL